METLGQAYGIRAPAEGQVIYRSLSIRNGHIERCSGGISSETFGAAINSTISGVRVEDVHLRLCGSSIFVHNGTVRDCTVSESQNGFALEGGTIVGCTLEAFVSGFAFNLRNAVAVGCSVSSPTPESPVVVADSFGFVVSTSVLSDCAASRCSTPFELSFGSRASNCVASGGVSSVSSSSARVNCNF